MTNIIAGRYPKAIAGRYAPMLDSGFPIPEMKTVEEVRRERLALLRKELGTLVALNEKLGLNARDATLSQILNSAKNSRTGTAKQMGSKLARDLESACGKEVGWMDTDPLLAGGGLSPEVSAFALAVERLPKHLKSSVLGVAMSALAIAQSSVEPEPPAPASSYSESAHPPRSAGGGGKR